ncbi:MAG: diacylglycerol kinase family protein [Bacteroidota bacterium]
MKLLFIVNPISGGVDKEPFLKEAKEICKKYGIIYKIIKTTGNNDEQKVNEQLSKFKPDKVISVGGDGTTLFTSIILLNTNYPMGIIPLGSANGMAVELNVNPDPLEALKEIIISQVVSEMDMIMVNKKHYSIHIGDVGINANIVEAYEKDENRGMITYAKYFMDELNKTELINFKIKANEKTYSEKGLMLGICNSRKYGTGVPLNIAGNPMDGKFEIVIVKDINLNSLIKAGLSKFDEKFHDSQNGVVISTDNAEIIFDQPRLLQLDGEVIGMFDKLNIKILKGAVKLITNNDNPYL